jgi:hypothetical protein
MTPADSAKAPLPLALPARTKVEPIVKPLDVPDWLYEINEAKEIVNSDREMISKMIGVYSFAFGPYPLMRYTSALNSTIQSLLVKGNRYTKYKDFFQTIDGKWDEARQLMNNELDHDVATVLFMQIERVLKIIAEKESLTLHRQEYFDGRLMVEAKDPGAAQGGLATDADPYLR